MDWDILNSTVVVSECSNSDLSRQIRLKDYIRDIHISEFSTEWERHILDLIPYKDRRKHSGFINSVLDEVKELYIENMKYFILKSILSCKVYKREHIACEECNIPSGLKQHIIEKDMMYDHSVFLKHRYSFVKKYFLSNQIIRRVMNTAHRILPTIICDFKHYHEFGMLTLHSFRDMVFKDVKRSSLVITNQFYTETFKAIQKSKVLKTISKKYLLQLMRCLTNVFVQQILNVMMRSIDHIISVMRDAHFCPQIKFHLVCEDNHLVTKPDIMEVFSMYHNIIRNIETIAQDLIPLEEWLNIKMKEKYIKISLPEWFIEESHHNLQKILDVLFEPVNKHIGFVSAEFDNVCASSIKNRMLSITSGQPDFDAYLIYIHKYNNYLSKANSMLSNLYYNVGKLEQINAKEFMKQVCCDVVNVLTIELVRYHQDFNRSICSDFEDFKSTALDIPKDAESLIQLGEYMSQSLKVLMKELEERIRQSIYMLGRLLEITVLSDEHIDLNRTTINWLHDIQPVFAQNNTLCEAMKSELEEDLQRRINTLNIEVDATFPQLVILDDMDDISRIREYMEHYKDLIRRYNRIDKEMGIINMEENLFKFPETEFPKINELKETIVPFYMLIRTIYQWRRDNSVWLNGPFEHLDASVIEKKTISYYDEIAEMNKTMKSRIKMDATTNKSYKFSGIADDPDPMQQPAPLKLCWQALNNVNEFKIYIPLATCMCNSALESRHWKEMSAICNFDLTPNAGTTLKKMIDMNLMDNIDKYKAISLGANKELRLQRELAEMIKEWEPISFEISIDTQSNIMVFKYMDDIEVLLMEHLIKIEEMRASHFVKPILSDIIDFLGVLTRIQESLDQWMRIQYRRFSLKPIFSYSGIATSLNQETALYLEATRILMDVTNRFTENPSFQEIKSMNLLQILSQVDEKLEKISRDVKDYLDTKRLSFTRFFFLEDSEIQKILFESNDTVKRHTLVKKCFGGIERLKFNKSNCIRSIIGNYGDSLRLNDVSMFTDAKCEEKWLIQLEKEMKNAIRENILQYYSSIDKNWMTIPIDNFPSMAIICGFQLYWTSSVERCLMSLNTTVLKSLFIRYADRIISITKELKDNLTRKRRSLLMSLIIVLSIHKEVIQLLLDRNITKRTDFEWTAQLRYYFHGPTGTGKTETIKSLTSALAKPFYIVNCNDGTPYEYTTQILKGVISCDAWICFENFNRLRLELLSIIAQNLTQIKQAVSSNLKIIYRSAG